MFIPGHCLSFFKQNLLRMLGSTFLDNLLRKRNAVTVMSICTRRKITIELFATELNPLVYISENLCSKYEYNL